MEDRADTKWQKETFVWVEMYLGCCGGFTGVHTGENSSNCAPTMGVVCCMQITNQFSWLKSLPNTFQKEFLGFISNPQLNGLDR